MFTKKELATYVNDKFKEELASIHPAPYAVTSGIYQAMHNDVYDRYIELSKSVDRLIASLKEMDPDSLSDDVRLAMGSLPIIIAREFIQKDID